MSTRDHNHRNRTTCMHKNRKPCISFSWSTWLAAWSASMCPRMMSHNMAAILQLIGWPKHQQPWLLTSLILDIHVTVKTRNLLNRITWIYLGLRFRAHRSCIIFWSWPLHRCWFPIRLQAQARSLYVLTHPPWVSDSNDYDTWTIHVQSIVV